MRLRSTGIAFVSGEKERSQSRTPSSSGLLAAQERQLGTAGDARVQALRDVAGARLELVLEQVGRLARAPLAPARRAASRSPSSIHAISLRSSSGSAQMQRESPERPASRVPGNGVAMAVRLAWPGVGSLLRGRRRHDHDRDVRMARALVADRTEHEPDEAAVPARADDQEIGVLRLVE